MSRFIEASFLHDERTMSAGAMRPCVIRVFDLPSLIKGLNENIENGKTHGQS
jgi:hypothetical protein